MKVSTVLLRLPFKAAEELDEMPVFKLKRALEKTEKIHQVPIE
jgi:hypothetical protein